MKYYFININRQEHGFDRTIGSPQNFSLVTKKHPFKWINDFNSNHYYGQQLPREFATLINYKEISEEEYDNY